MNCLISIIFPYSWISPSPVLMMHPNVLPPESIFFFPLFLFLSIHLHSTPLHVCVCSPDSNDGAIYVWLHAACVCVCVCEGYVEAEELTMSYPPTVQPSTQEDVIIKRKNSHAVHSVQKSVCTHWLLRRSTRLH